MTRDGGAAAQNGRLTEVTSGGCSARLRRGRRRHAELVAAVRRLLAGYGCLEFPVKQMATPRRGRDGSTVYCRGQMRPGVADVCACGPRGQFIGVECKIGRDALRLEQAAFGQEILRRGGVWLVARDSVDVVIQARRQITQQEV